MIDLVKKFFSKRTDDNTGNTRKKSSEDILVSTCALLLEMSVIDGEFSETEKQKILSILKEEYALPEEYAEALLETSKERLDDSTDLWRFASLINQSYSVEEKERIIEMIWRIAYADGTLEKHEDYLVHKLANLLRLTHKQLINAKLKAKP
ncbi:MAG: hypothetical protein DRH37_10690 [Deltaproteobacteria bacterium]|nr:MAG: hypothetical protein DRH37_10690 [Deltaproteobacteria bacterium]